MAKDKTYTISGLKPREASPGYQRIEQDLRRHIQTGDWPVGSFVPSRRDLAAAYGVDLNTLQRAMGALLEDGILVSDGRRGTRVASGASTPSGQERFAAKPITVDTHETDGNAGVSRKQPQTAGSLGIVAQLDPHSVATADYGDFWSGEIVATLMREFQKTGGKATFYNSSGPGATIPEYVAIASLLEEGINALAVILPVEAPAAIAQALTTIVETNIPLIFINDKAIKGPFPHIFYDQHTSGYQAAQHLIRCGYKQFMFIFPFQAAWVDERIEGAIHALEDSGLSANALAIHVEQRPQFDMTTFNEGYEMAAPIAQSGRLDGCGIIAGNDTAAEGIFKAAAAAGRSAGRDFGLIGFDNSPHSRELGITTVCPPFAAMAEHAAGLLSRALQGEELPVQVRMRARVVPRASTFSPPGARHRG